MPSGLFVKWKDETKDYAEVVVLHMYVGGEVRVQLMGRSCRTSFIGMYPHVCWS